VRVDAGELDADAAFEANGPALQRLQREEVDIVLPAVGQIFLVAADLRVLGNVLDAGRSAPAAALGLDDIGARLAAIREEAGSDRSIGLEFVVMVFRDPAAEFENLEKAADGDVHAGIATVLV